MKHSIQIVLGFVLAFNQAFAQQPGATDISFNAADLGYGAGSGPQTNGLSALAIQADGGILIGGSIQRFNNVQRNNLVRLTPDGNVDLSFAPSSLGAVNDLVVQPDGKILVASGLVYRLLPNGTHDPTFSNAVGTEVRRIQLQPDGRILAVVEQSPFNPDLVRLMPNGELDPSFSFDLSGYSIDAMALLPSGQILAAVDYNGTGSKLLRFNSDGTQDNTFNCCPGPDLGGVGRILLQPDGRILVSGTFNAYNGAARPRLVRLESNGNVDLSFDAGSSSSGPNLSPMLLRADGRILCSGTFSTVQGQNIPGLVQLLPNGTVDSNFSVGAGFLNASGTVTGPLDVALDGTGRMVCLGNFVFCDGAVRMRLARLLSNGALDAAFHQQTGVLGTVQDIAVRSDGRILVAGSLSYVNGVPRRGLARLLADGSIDPAFATTSIALSSTLSRVAEQSTGKVVVMGQVNGSSTYAIGRINADGSPDAGFTTGTGFNGAIVDIALQPDDKIIAGGAFTSYNGNTVGRIVRLLPDGQIDPSFNTGSGFSGLMAQVNGVRVQPDGKVLVGGTFTQFNGSSAIRLIRLNSDGTRDTDFTASNTGEIRTMALRSDGRIVIAYFNLTYRIACLLPSGALDAGFNNGISIGTAVNEIVELADGSILLAGNFAVAGATVLTGFRLLTSSGQPDGAFAPGTGLGNPNSGLSAVGNCLAVQADGRILVGGQFTACNDVGRNRIARLFGVAASPGLLVSARTFLDGSFSTGLMSDALRSASLIPTMEPYTALGYSHVSGGGEQVSSAVLAVTGSNAIVDWVVVELRDASTPSNTLATRSALVQRDGDVVDLDGISPVSFNLPAGSFRVAIRHRNHLGVMTAAPVALSASSTIIDFTNSATAIYGTDARKNNNGTMTLWPGDVTFDGQVKYVGNGNDRDPILTAVGGSTPTNTVTGVYAGTDVNMDGAIKYIGNNNDRDVILQTIGGSTPTAVRIHQLP